MKNIISAILISLSLNLIPNDAWARNCKLFVDIKETDQSCKLRKFVKKIPSYIVSKDFVLVSDENKADYVLTLDSGDSNVYSMGESCTAWFTIEDTKTNKLYVSEGVRRATFNIMPFLSPVAPFYRSMGKWAYKKLLKNLPNCNDVPSLLAE